MSDDFGDRMKMLEKMECGRRLLPLLPVMVRIDGKCFSSYTRDMDRPYDTRLIKVMQDVTGYLVKETGAKIGYTQSDEITLILYSNNYKSEIFFDGKIQKLTSVLASMTTARFNELARVEWPEKKPALFDCRVWQVPTKWEAANALLWREQDATKNSISMLAREHFSHKQLENKNRSDMHEMLHRVGVSWNDEPAHFKRGSYFQRTTRVRVLTPEERSRIPEEFQPAGPVSRSEIVELDMPPLGHIQNRVDVIFDGAPYVVAQEFDYQRLGG